MLTLAEDILLLLLDDESGELANIDLMTLNYAMAGAVLMDLGLKNRIDNDLEKLIVADSTPTGIAMLDKYLQKINSENNDNNTRFWLTELSNYGEEIMDSAIEMLIDKKILKMEEKKFLWVIGTRVYPMIDDTEEKEVKKRIIDLLMSDDIPSPKDVVLVSLMDTCSLFTTFLSEKEVERLSDRIELIKKLDLIAQEVTNVLERLRSDIAEAMLMLPT
ncbi:MAG TPA: GPP34 family phosphoprotein [Thermodesulfobacteriota bacterium]|nr:GPP34 family phosphoprotein [Thermodesulfobacteriota bacterium]